MSAPAMEPTRGTALVTGACSGIGLALARQLAARGHALVLVSNRAAELAEVAAQLRETTEVQTIAQDLAVPGAAEALVAEVDRHGLTIDVLINNAGMFFHGEAADADPGRAQAMLHLHVMTPSLLCTYFAARMRARRRGHIMIVASISAWRGFPGIGYYGSSKAYLRGFAQALRSELAVYGVQVTCLAPGATATGLYEGSGVPVALARRLGVMMDAEAVAAAGLRAMVRGEALCVPGVLARAMTLAAVCTPQPVVDWLWRRAWWTRPRPSADHSP